MGGCYIRTYNNSQKETAYLGTGSDHAGQLRVYNKEGITSSYLGDGYYQAYNQFGERTLFLGTGTSGGGYLRTYNFEGQETMYIGTGADSSGQLLSLIHI